MNIKVGDALYRFDINRRVYPEGRCMGGPIYAEHFTAHVVTGETKQSWLVKIFRDETRVNKKTLREAGRGGMDGHRWFTADGMAGDIWKQENRLRIVRAVENASGETLMAIDALLKSEAAE